MKRNPKSKRLHDSDSGRFLPEDVADGLTPFGYNDESGPNYGAILLAVCLLLVIGAVGYAYYTGAAPF